ncbi:MAG: DUF2339 domain-containing protein [Muribaculaceae bacterium]|nr:DUF2339 domain-containing protein [Muribaculaceae bacterium]
MEFIALLFLAAIIYVIVVVRDVNYKVDHLSQRVEDIAYRQQVADSVAFHPTIGTPMTEAEVHIEPKPEPVPEPVQPMPTPPPLVQWEPEEVEQPIAEAETEPLQVLEEDVLEPVAHKGRNFEKFIGENLFGKIGVIVFIIGIGFFVKYAIDKNWINEVARTISGYAVSVAMLGIGARLHRQYRTYSSLIMGGAFGVAYVTTAVAYHYYHLFGSTVAFSILVGVTILMAALAYITDKRELAIIALVGGFIAPFIASNENGSVVALFSYILVLNLGMTALSLIKRWSELPIIACVATWVLLLLLGNGYDVDKNRTQRILFAFSTCYLLLFMASATYTLHRDGSQWQSRILASMLVFNSFIYLLFNIDCGTYFAHWNDGLFCISIALCHVASIALIWRKRDNNPIAYHTHLSLAISFLAIAVPMEFSNFQIVTLVWAVQTAIIFYLYARSHTHIFAWGSFALAALTLISYLTHSLFTAPSGEHMFANSDFSCGIVYAGSALAVALMCDRNLGQLRQAWKIKWGFITIISYLVAIGVFYKAFVTEFNCHMPAPLSGAMIGLFTAALVLGLCLAFYKRMNINKNLAFYLLMGFVSMMTLAVQAVVTTTPIHGIAIIAMHWLNVIAVAATLAFIARQYYLANWPGERLVTIVLNVLATVAVVSFARLLLLQTGITDFSAGLSLSLAVAGFAQMLLGMRLHHKDFRIVSLFTLGLVLLKLVLNDLLRMPAVGKIITFIVLGLLLLVLSFLYQRLKNVLFDDNDDVTK